MLSLSEHLLMLWWIDAHRTCRRRQRDAFIIRTLAHAVVDRHSCYLLEASTRCFHFTGSCPREAGGIIKMKRASWRRSVVDRLMLSMGYGVGRDIAGLDRLTNTVLIISGPY